MLIHDLCLLSILPVHRGSSGYWWMDRGNAEGTYVHKISDTCYYSPVYVDDDDDEIPSGQPHQEDKMRVSNRI